MPKKRKWNMVDKKAAKMPPLCHSTTEPFDITKSEVAQWLCSQPEVMQMAFDVAHDHGAIIYDPRTKTWEGIGYGID